MDRFRRARYERVDSLLGIPLWTGCPSDDEFDASKGSAQSSSENLTDADSGARNWQTLQNVTKISNKSTMSPFVCHL